MTFEVEASGALSTPTLCVKHWFFIRAQKPPQHSLDDEKKFQYTWLAKVSVNENHSKLSLRLAIKV